MKHWHHRGGRGRREAHPTQPTSKERIVQGEESLRRRGARRWGEVFLFHFLCLSYELYFFITGYLILCMLSLVSFILFKACLISKRLVLTSTSGEWTLNNSSVNVDNVKEFNKFIQIILIFCPWVAHRRGYRTLMRHCPSSFFKVKVQKLIQLPLRSRAGLARRRRHRSAGVQDRRRQTSQRHAGGPFYFYLFIIIF